MPELTKAVFVVFAILVPILLLNMLIAMMANTYEHIISRSEKEWKRQVTIQLNATDQVTRWICLSDGYQLLNCVMQDCKARKSKK